MTHIGNFLAERIVIGDFLNIGGQMHQVTKVNENDYGDVVLHLWAVKMTKKKRIMLIVPPDMTFELFGPTL